MQKFFRLPVKFYFCPNFCFKADCQQAKKKKATVSAESGREPFNVEYN
jgi:hypothetical protein